MEINKPLTNTVLKAPSTDLPEKVVKYFESRGIPEGVLKRNKIGFKNDEIMFPYFRDGEVVNIKYRKRDKKFRQVSEAEKIFYGLDDLNGSEEAIIVEGEFDKLAFEVVGYKNVLSVPDGAPSLKAKNYESKFSYIENCESKLKGLKKIILAVDGDKPGKKLEEELIRRLGPERCWRVVWPEGCKDANDVIIKYSEFELLKIIDEAKPVPVAGLFSVNDFSEELLTLYDKGQPGGESTGWSSLDKHYTVRQGELTIVTGIPSHGKSEKIDALMVNLAKRNDWRFAVFSPENHPVQTHIAKLIQKYVGKPFGKNYVNHMTKDELITAKEWLEEHFVFVSPPDDELTIDHIISKAKAAVARYGIKGLSIDPWNEIDHSRSPYKSETEYISECLTKIRRFARTYRVHVWLIAHPTKLTKNKNGQYPVPTPYDVAGSAHFRNKADNCLCVWRDLEDEGKETEVHVQKIRFREIGKVGMVKLKYDISSGRYSCSGVGERPY
jgi:twinkle protein